MDTYNPPLLRHGQPYSFLCLTHPLQHFLNTSSDGLPVTGGEGRLPRERGPIVEHKTIRVITSLQRGQHFVDLVEKSVGVVSEKPVLKDQLVKGWASFVESDKLHVVLVVEIDSEGVVLSSQVHLKQFHLVFLT